MCIRLDIIKEFSRVSLGIISLTFSLVSLILFRPRFLRHPPSFVSCLGYVTLTSSGPPLLQHILKARQCQMFCVLGGVPVWQLRASPDYSRWSVLSPDPVFLQDSARVIITGFSKVELNYYSAKTAKAPTIPIFSTHILLSSLSHLSCSHPHHTHTHTHTHTLSHSMTQSLTLLYSQKLSSTSQEDPCYFTSFLASLWSCIVLWLSFTLKIICSGKWVQSILFLYSSQFLHSGWLFLWFHVNFMILFFLTAE